MPDQYAELHSDCIRFTNQHLQDLGGFVNDVLEFLEDQQKRVMLGENLIPADYLQMRITTEAQLIWSIQDRIRAID
ncbi:hypothetical protein ACTXG7_05330 [Mycolicibacterium sp. Dal123E01]|uniref:hypothetical protein n=1 Tax=Mycolicibacterium sp. Dal123E01 TaxID=3457578 RepID=UPI00403EC7D2